MRNSSPRKCSLKSCDRKLYANDFCEAHNWRFKKFGDPQESVPIQGKNAGKKCSVDDCENSAKARGWCKKHWNRWSNHGDPLVVLPTKRYRHNPDDVSTGQQFGRWTVTGSYVRQDNGQARFPCQCECGTTRDVAFKQLRHSGSCGCLQREVVRALRTTHGYNLPDAHPRARWLWATYKVHWNDYVTRIEEQGGTCAICPAPISVDDPSTHLDHCHETNVIRGVLCMKCNLALGYMADDPNRFIAAATYLIQTRELSPLANIND